VQDLLSVANTIRTTTYASVSTYVGVGALYFLLCLLTSWLFGRIERGLPLNRALRAAGMQGGSHGPSSLVLNAQVPQP
jgi:hypothetical protein